MTNITRSAVSAAALLVALTGCSVPPSVDASQAAQNANTPGWTGRTFVTGSTSTVAGNAPGNLRAAEMGRRQNALISAGLPPRQ